MQNPSPSTKGVKKQWGESGSGSSPWLSKGLQYCCLATPPHAAQALLTPPHKVASAGTALALSAFPTQLRKGWSPEILTSALPLLPGYLHSERGKGRIWSLMCIVEIVRKIILCSYSKCATWETSAEEQFPGPYVSAPSGSRGNIYLHFSLNSTPLICFSQANSVWAMTRQHPISRHWHVLCN